MLLNDLALHYRLIGLLGLILVLGMGTREAIGSNIVDQCLNGTSSPYPPALPYWSEGCTNLGGSQVYVCTGIYAWDAEIGVNGPVIATCADGGTAPSNGLFDSWLCAASESSPISVNSTPAEIAQAAQFDLQCGDWHYIGANPGNPGILSAGNIRDSNGSLIVPIYTSGPLTCTQVTPTGNFPQCSAKKYALEISVNGTPASSTDISVQSSVYSDPGCSLQNVPSQNMVSVACVDTTTGQHASGCKYGVSIAPGSDTGGHDHGPASGRPLGKIPSQILAGNQDIGTGTSFIYEAPEISQQVQLTISGVDPNGKPLNPITQNLDIQVPGSNSWVGLSNDKGVDVIIDGADPSPSHPRGFYGTLDMQAAVEQLGIKFSNQLAFLINIPRIKSQAASLPWGGLYDIEKDWDTPHCGHRDGVTIDLSLNGLSSIEKNALKFAAQQSKLRFYYIPESPQNLKANHWHAVLGRQ